MVRQVLYIMFVFVVCIICYFLYVLVCGLVIVGVSCLWGGFVVLFFKGVGIMK